jgi:hypothetical protein
VDEEDPECADEDEAVVVGVEILSRISLFLMSFQLECIHNE